MISRKLAPVLLLYAKEFPVVALLGPRQSGKTTLAQAIFSNHRYVSLESLQEREFAQRDPRGFLQEYTNENGIILDEIQHVPDLLSYIQVQVDEQKKPGYFILTGSQNFLVNEVISQSLAGRVAILTLLPLSISELQTVNLLPEKIETVLYRGSYPSLYASLTITPFMWYPNYIQTYLERDVRDLKHVIDLSTFKRFIQLCAGRIGQTLNIASLASDCGISQITAKGWISLLEASYIIFLLQPHYKNFSKRLIKTPKLYFYDTGLACSLLGIESQEQLAMHYLRGGLFESFVIAEFFKDYYNAGRVPRLYFWRDNHGHEIDCIVEQALTLIPVEIKSGKTVTTDFFENIHYWKQLAGDQASNGFIIYAGDNGQRRTDITVLNWQATDTVIKFNVNSI